MAEEETISIAEKKKQEPSFLVWNLESGSLCISE